MKNLIASNRKSLELKCYVRKADPDANYWFDFSQGKLDKYIAEVGVEKLALIIQGSDQLEGDFFVLPYLMIQHMMTAQTRSAGKTDANRSRWVGWIEQNRLRITNSQAVLDVRDFYGNPSQLPLELKTEKSEDDFAIENSKAEIAVRQKQSLFRSRVFKRYGKRCCLSGVTEENLLVASHIVPWSKKIDSRLDPANGLCLMILYDQLFDQGYITFDTDFNVVVTPQKELSEPLRGILDFIRGRSADISVSRRPKEEYMSYHRAEIFRSA